MKGVVFVELLAMAEDVLGEEVVDDILSTVELESGGVYTSVGTYSCDELFTLVAEISRRSGIASDALQQAFGQKMMDYFVVNYPGFFENRSHCFQMLESIEDDIHVEVRKLYPDAELPRFETVRHSDTSLELIYRSPRPLGEFCDGLIKACVTQFGQQADVTRHVPDDKTNQIHFSVDLKTDAS